MRMSSFLVQSAIIPRLESKTKDAVIREMVTSLAQSGEVNLSEVDEIVQSVMRREALGSTGIGHNIAIPHSKHVGVSHLIGTIGISNDGIPFEAIDGELVYVLVLLISPQNKPGEHLRALESVVRTMRNEAFMQALRQAQTADTIWKLIEAEQG